MPEKKKDQKKPRDGFRLFSGLVFDFDCYLGCGFSRVRFPDDSEVS